MHILTIGLNHETAPVELRERLAFSEDRLDYALRTLRDMKSIMECVILSTCNRMELYVVCDQLHTGEYYAKTFIENWFRIPKEEFCDYLYVKKNEDAIRHLFHVVCGMNSLVLGETQILGQVKQAFFTAMESKTTGTLFNTLFKQAVTFGKRVHSETEIGQNAVSVSYVAVELGKKMFDSFEDKTILLVGAGEMSELTAKHFYSNGAKRVQVVNRTFSKAEELAGKFHGEARPWEDLIACLKEADIVVSSTGAKEPVLTRSMVEPVLKSRRSPLFLIDIAVPRDIEPSIAGLESVFLYDIDDLREIAESNMSLRQKEAEKIKGWIEEEVREFNTWLDTLGVVPLISALREKALSIQEDAVNKIERKLPEMTEREKRVIRKHTKSIVNQMMRDPIVRLKELATTPQKEAAQEMFVYLFALEELLKQEDEEEPAKVEVKNPALGQEAWARI